MRRAQVTISIALVAALAGCEPGLTASPSALVSLQGGQFLMGGNQDCTDAVAGVSCKGDRVEHLVRVSPFELQATEVSRIQYATCALSGACRAQGAFDPKLKDLPMVVDDPDAAREYCATLGMRLPTEAEFEYAARVSPGGTEHLYPWGDGPPTCDKLNLAGCDDRFSLEVGSAPGDVTESGVHDLAGSVPEWVEDRYQATLGCQDRIGYADLCYGQSASCPEVRCTSDGKFCSRGCLPPSEDVASASRGAQVTSTPMCPLDPNGLDAPPQVDPVIRTASGFAVVRGGSPADGLCAFAGFTRRHALPRRYQAGFRCARSSLKGAMPLPLSGYRFTLAGCPEGDSTVRVAAATDVNPNAGFHLEWFPPSGEMDFADAKAGFVDGAPCDAVFVLFAGPTPLKLSFTAAAPGRMRCAEGARAIDLTGGGDVPPIGTDTVILGGVSCK